MQKRPEIVTIEVPFVNPEEMVFDDESTRILPDCDGAGGDDAADGGQAAGVDSDGVGDCGDTPWGSYKANSNDYDASFDPNAYISDPPVDVATQAGAGASEFRDLGTQFPYQFDPDWHQNHVHSQTNVNDFMYPTEIYLETIFRDFITESQNFIPAQHLSILQLSRFHETDKEKASRWGFIVNFTANCFSPPKTHPSFATYCFFLLFLKSGWGCAKRRDHLYWKKRRSSA